MEPINYSLSAPNPSEAFLQGFQGGAGIQNIQIAQQQKQLELQQKQNLQQNLMALGSNPTPSAIAKLSALHPELSEQFKHSYDMLNEEEKKTKLAAAVPIYNAIGNKQYDIAAKQMNNIADALDNSGKPEEAARQRAMAQYVTDHPETAYVSYGANLAQIMGPDKFAETFKHLSENARDQASAPAELTKKESDAQSAAVAAKFADSKAAQDLVKGGWDIKKVANDINVANANTRIATINASLSKETNDLKRQELKSKLQEESIKRDATIRENAANVNSARFNIDNMLNTADRILKTPDDVQRAATGPIDDKLPTLQPSVADFEELLTTMGDQTFLSRVQQMKGFGSLSDGDRKALTSSLQSLKARQSTPRLLENVREAQRLLLKLRGNISSEFGIPDTTPDTPAAEPTPDEINALMKKHGQ